MAASEALIAAGVATGGMLAKLNAAHSALRQGVARCASARARPITFWNAFWRRRGRAPAGGGGGLRADDQRSYAKTPSSNMPAPHARIRSPQGRHARYRADPDAHQRLRGQRHHAAAHRIRGFRRHSRFLRHRWRTAAWWAAARCTSIRRPSARSGRWPWPKRSRRTASAGGLIETLVAEANAVFARCRLRLHLRARFFRKWAFTKSSAASCR